MVLSAVYPFIMESMYTYVLRRARLIYKLSVHTTVLTTGRRLVGAPLAGNKTC